MKNIIILLLTISIYSNAQTIKYNPCSFSVELPSELKLSNKGATLDYCDYEVTSKDGLKLIEFHSMTLSRFELSTIKEFYLVAINNTQLDITYKTLTDNFFVLSGINKETGKTFYWKRVVGDNFVSDLQIEYVQSQKNNIEPYIGKISKSFSSN